MELCSSTIRRIAETLRRRFVYSDDVARILALALHSDDNVLLWGPAGHGKSEMVQAALAVVTQGEPVYTHSFGEGMTEDRLWGGIDLAALKDNVLRNLPENSFLPHRLAVFEEMLDAPAVVLMALKDTLSAGELRKGRQRFKMETTTIVAITNKDPREMSALGPAAHALMERFPFQLKVEWPSYTSMDYLQMFDLIERLLQGPPVGDMAPYLAELLADIGTAGEIISPRLARQALKAVKTAAALRGSSTVERMDFVDLRFLPGMSQSAHNIQNDLERLIERKAAEKRLTDAERRFHELMRRMREVTLSRNGHDMLDMGGVFLRFQDEVAILRVTDDFASRRRALRESVETQVTEANRLAVEYARVSNGSL